MGDVIGMAASRPAMVGVPAGRPVALARGGSCFVSELPGPEGAPTVVLLHGLFATASLNWFPAMRRLAEEYRVVALDLRGHGRTVSPGRFRLADCADDVAAVADALGVGRFVVVGYSLGGPVAQLVWHRHRPRVQGMVLCATSRNFGGSGLERAFFTAVTGGLAGWRVARRLPGPWRAGPGRRDRPGPGGPGPGGPDPGGDADAGDQLMIRWAFAELGRNRPDTIVNALSAIGRFTSHQWAGDIDVPTAVVVTTQDRLVSPHRQIKLARAIPGATLHPVRAGHAACVLGARQFVPTLAEACRSVVQRAG